MPSARARGLPAWVVVLLVAGTLALVWSLARPEAGSSPPVAPMPTAVLPSATAAASPVPDSTPDSDLSRVPQSALPAEAQATLELIWSGGPFPFDEDGEVFGNRERLLPEQPRGYYREFTVLTPGEGDRGARRIVQGSGGDLYWTRDHYATFRQIAVGR